MLVILDQTFKQSLIDQGNVDQNKIFDLLISLHGKKYRDQDNRRTIQFQLNNRSYFIKQHFGVGWREIFKNLLYGRLPIISANNEWRAILKFNALHIDTMKLVAYGYCGFNPAKIKSFVVTETLQYVGSLETICANWKTNPPDFSFKKTLIKKLAHIARTLHENGVNHRDFYLCHFLLHQKTDQHSKIILYLIDLHRVQIRDKTPERWKIKDISGLYFSSLDAGLTQRDVLRFLKSYFNTSLSTILREHENFLQQVEKRAVKLYLKTFKQQPILPIASKKKNSP